MSRDVTLDFRDNGNLFYSNCTAYLNVRDPYDFSLTESTTKIVRLLNLRVLLHFLIKSHIYWGDIVWYMPGMLVIQFYILSCILQETNAAF